MVAITLAQFKVSYNSWLFILDIGPVKAYKLIKELKTIENVIIEVGKQNEQIDKSAKKKRRYIVPKEFLYKESR